MGKVEIRTYCTMGSSSAETFDVLSQGLAGDEGVFCI